MYKEIVRMRKIKFASVCMLGLGMLMSTGIGVAYGQGYGTDKSPRNIPGFRGMDKRQKQVTPPPPPADTVDGPNTDCTLILPKSPLSAQGLATPFQLTATDPNQGPCDETNNAQSAFVQAGIFDPATGQITVYNPLIINKGTAPAVAPVVPTLPPHAIVALWFGYNADNLTLQGQTPRDLLAVGCVNGLPGSEFSQFSYCNAPAFFLAANFAIARGTLKVPALGTASDGLACPTVRDFFVVDQDQSDNLPTTYLITTDGKLAQYNQANLAALTGATVLGNPSDNRLTDVFLDGALGCQPWTVTDLTDQGQANPMKVPALPLNELQARMEQKTPVALIPANDPMAQLSGNEDILKVNLYRLGVDQPVGNSFADMDPARYCRQMLRIAPGRMFMDQGKLTAFRTPDAGAANSLFTFMAERFVASYQILNCESLIQQADPITVTTDTNGVATGATLNTLTYSEQIQDLAGKKSADDYADRAALSLGLFE
jgi:hypothetical protein